MLLTIRFMKELQFGKLMEVYLEGNREKECGLLQAEQDFYDYLRQCFFATQGAVYYVWSEEEQYLSALRLEPYKDGWLLEALETHPDYRRRGYGKRLIEAVMALGEYPVIYSHVHKQNEPSLRLHRKVGFTVVAPYAVYIDGSMNNRCYTFRYVRKEE